MNVRYSNVYFYIFLTVLFILVAVNCNQSQDSTKTTVPGKSNAVNVTDSKVGDPSAKKSTESLYQITTVTTIGIEEAKNEDEMPYQIASIRNIDCDAEGNLYLLESKTHCVKVFDQKGKFLRQMFRMGRGPNEIYLPAYCRINKFSNTLFQPIDFGHTIKQFTLKGEFLSTIQPPEQILENYEFLSENRLIYVANCIYRENNYYNFKVLDLDKKKIIQSLVPMMLSERPDSFNSLQRFVIKDNLLWTSTIDDTHLLVFDLSNGRKVKKLTVSNEVKKNQVISYTHNGLKYVPVVDVPWPVPKFQFYAFRLNNNEDEDLLFVRLKLKI